jgi:hypothetical protein
VPGMRLFVVTAALAALIGCEKAASESGSSSAAAAEASVPATPVTRAAPVDLCSLVTKAEAEAILGKSLAPPQKQRGGDCWYMREGGTDFGDVEFILSIINAPVPVRTPQEFEAFVADQVKDMNDNLKQSGVAATPYKLERADGVGAPAYFIDPGLYVLKGNRILAVGLGGSQGVAIAKTALARMP